MNCPVTGGLATLGKTEQPLEGAGEASDSRFGRTVSDKLVLCQSILDIVLTMRNPIRGTFVVSCASTKWTEGRKPLFNSYRPNSF